MPGRSYTGTSYCYGFSGKEKDDEIKGNGNSYNFEARIQDPRLGRFLTLDPMQVKYASKTPYGYCSDNPISRVDNDGKEDITFHSFTYATTYKINGEYKFSTHTVNHVEVVRNNSKNTYTAHNVVVTDDVTNHTYGVNDYSKNVSLDAGEYLSENWKEVSAHYTPEISATGQASSARAANQAELIHLKDAYQRDKKEDDNNIAALSLMANVVPGEEFLALSIEAKLGGRLGTAATRNQIADIAAELKSRGYKITGGGGEEAEEYLKPLGGGRKGGSYLDITAFHPDYGTLRINTVDVLADGITPTARELRNATRIRTQIPAGEHLLLIPKTK